MRVPHPIELDDLRKHVRVLLEGVRREGVTGRLWIVESGRIRQYDPEA